MRALLKLKEEDAEDIAKAMKAVLAVHVGAHEIKPRMTVRQEKNPDRRPRGDGQGARRRVGCENPRSTRPDLAPGDRQG